MTVNRHNINELRNLARNSLIIPSNLDIRRNRTDFAILQSPFSISST